MASATLAPAYSAQVYRAIQPSLALVVTDGADDGHTEDQGLGSGVLISDQGEMLAAAQVAFADGT